MIRQMIYWYILSCKRILKRPIFVMFLCFVLIGAGWFRNVEEQDSGKIPVALYTSSDGWNDRVANVLLQEEGSFDFYLCESQEQLEEDVASGRAECGYSFPDGLKTQLLENDYKDSITVTVSPATVSADLISETVFAGMFSVWGKELLEDYVVNGDIFEETRKFNEDVWNSIAPSYEEFLTNGSTFRFEYASIDGEIVEKPKMKAIFPVRGLGAVSIMVMGLAAAVMAIEDDENGFYSRTGIGRKRWFQTVSIAASVFISCLVVLGAIAIAGECNELYRELLNLLIYGGIAVWFSMMIVICIPKSVIVAGMIPLFILGSLIACPVFADLSVFLPVLKIVRYFFIPWYYMSGILW